MKLAALACREGGEQVCLGRPRRLRCPCESSASAGSQLNAVSAPIRGIRRTMQEAAPLKLVQERDDVGGLDPKRRRKLALGAGALSVEVMQNRELGPPQAALGEAPTEAPRCSAREPQDQEAASRPQRRVPDVGRWWGGCGRDRIHVTDSYS